MKLDDMNKLWLTRRQILAGGAGIGALAAVGCGSGNSGDDDDDGNPDAGVGDLGPPEISNNLWQTMTAYARAGADGAIGTRINLFNSVGVTQRVVIQAFRQTGELVVKDYSWEEFPAGKSHHIELGPYLTEHGVPLPFEGTVWVGATPDDSTPKSRNSFMGLQGITFDWYGPARHQIASVHGMRDFGNSNHDATWSDLILPKIVSGPRYVSKVALLNASGDGVAEPLIARPEVVIRNDDGDELRRYEVGAMPPFNSRLLDVRELLDGDDLATGTIEIIDPAVGMIAFGFVFDTETDGIENADHFFDRHFVIEVEEE